MTTDVRVAQNFCGKFGGSLGLSTPGKWHLRASIRGGAGGNRTPVHQSVNGPATTIPDLEPDASSLAGQLPVTSGGPRIVFPNCQRSFSPSVVFPTVIPHFCCRAVMDWPRAALLLTMTL